MKKGDIVIIYDDPLTCLKQEGKAKLVKLVDDGGFWEGSRITRWEVKFLDDGYRTERTIKEIK